MNRSCRTSVTDCAAELRARAEKARVEAAGVPYGDDDYLYGYAAAYDEAASLVEALRSPARDDLAERLEAFARSIDERVTNGKWPNTHRRADDLREAAEALREPASTGVREDEAARVDPVTPPQEVVVIPRTRADLIERLEKDAADWEGASEIFKPTPSLLREAASTLQAYEKALREIADYHADPVPLARATLKGEKNG